jgi:NAD(P)H-dependent FMN reductase
MSGSSLRILAVAGSLHGESVTRVVILHVADRLKADGCAVDVLDLSKELLPLLNPDTSYEHPDYPKLKARVEAADVFILGTPDYHGSMSGALKNFLDHFWHEFAGKLFTSVVASHEKGLTVTDQIRTVARQCYAWSLPYGVSFADKQDVQAGKIVSDAFQKRLDMMIRDVRVYGEALARQRNLDLAGTEPGFLARLRPKT